MERVRGFEILPEFADKAEDIAIELGLSSFIPQRATRGSSGYDLRAIEDVVVYPGEVKLVGTGLTAYMQEDEELQLRSRSSFAKRKITLANCPGTVDSVTTALNKFVPRYLICTIIYPSSFLLLYEIL